jgi:hypothetical protein
MRNALVALLSIIGIVCLAPILYVGATLGFVLWLATTIYRLAQEAFRALKPVGTPETPKRLPYRVEPETGDIIFSLPDDQEVRIPYWQLVCQDPDSIIAKEINRSNRLPK